ncbi:MAG TPA: hypothetical protein VF912_09850 [Anaeromyxobacter sp.]
MRNGSPRAADVHRVAGEIDVLRSELGGLVGELDRRRHEAMDVRLQMSRHPIVVAVVATVASLVLGSALGLAVRGRRQRRRPSFRARETRRALGRLFEHPDRVAAEPSIASKVATAVVVAVATALAKRLVDRSIRPARA